MRFFADLHVHSHFSRATSRDLDVPTLLAWAQKKGLGLVGTGDFTHPGWLKELRESLEEDGDGFLVPKAEVVETVAASIPISTRSDVRFVLQVEISSIFKKGERVRKVHTLVYLPGLDSAEKFSSALGRLGNVTSDGRPILGLPPLDIFRLARDVHPEAVVIPAHVWTPHFSLFGSKSGFDAIEECFEDLAGEIFALETGLSSDVVMNRRWSALDRFSLVSSSDAHSPSKLGREATLFDCERSWKGLVAAMKGEGGLKGTVEFFPEEGKYHLDGHRKCGVRCTPEETRKLAGLCPVCGRAMTPGVLGRVETLADRPARPDLPGSPRQHSLIPLVEVLGELLGVGSGSKRVARAYERITGEYGPELDLLGWMSLDRLEGADAGLLAEALGRMRSGQVRIEGGFDGEYGRIGLFESGEVDSLRGQGLMFGIARDARPATRSVPLVPPGTAPGTTDAVDSKTLIQGKGKGGLSTEQAAAAEADGGAILVIAGPGTGKTRTLVSRIRRLLREGCKPSRILVLTFTNRAADEVRERIATMDEIRGMPLVTTFHSFALSALSRLAEARGYPPPEIVDSSEILHIFTDLLEARGETEADARAAELLRARNLGATPDVEDSRWLEMLNRRMAQRGVLDLDGMVPSLVRELEAAEGLAGRLPRHYQHVLVDEFQDIGRDQYRLLRLLKPDGEGLFAVGDPDQSIYAFRGSDPRAFDHFQEDWPVNRVFGLTMSHRCPPEVLNLASEVLTNGEPGGLRTAGSAGNLQSCLPDSGPVRVYKARSPLDEAAWICREIQGLLGGLDMLDSDADAGGVGLGDVAVLARTHRVLDPVADVLSGAGIPVERASDRPLWDNPWVRVIMEALQEEDSDSDPLTVARDALESAGLRPPGRDVRALMGLVDGMSPEKGAAHLATLCEVDAFGLSPERVNLLTVHAAKGLEFECVYLAGCEDGVLPLARERRAEEVDMDEERRLLFVALTRAGRQLTVSYPSARGRGGGRLSSFITKEALNRLELVDSTAIPKRPKVVQQGLFDEMQGS